MGHNDHIDFELSEILADALDASDLSPTSAAYGVARQVIEQGDEGLSPKQRAVYDAIIVPLLIKEGERRDARERQRRLEEG